MNKSKDISKILLILLVSVFVLIFETLKGKIDVKKDKEMTVHKRSKDYVKRTVYLKEFAKDMRTSGIFNAMYARYKNAVEKNREIIISREHPSISFVLKKNK